MIYSLVISYNRKINENIVNFSKKHGIFPVIFDNSTVESLRKENEKFCKVNGINYETLSSNCGLSKAYNHVIKKYLAENDWIILLDQDTNVPEDYFKKVNEVVERANKLCYFAMFKYGKNKYGPKVFTNYKKVKAKKTKTICHLNDYLIGINSCTLINKKVFDQIGYFNEDLFMDYVDVDFCVRLAKNNIMSETIDIVIGQEFFSKNKNTYKSIKRRYANQMMDLSIFSKTLPTNWFNKMMYRFKESTKFKILYSLHNNIFYFVPLCFVRKRHINSGK